jgi:dUTP pyrophosphatase
MFDVEEYRPRTVSWLIETVPVGIKILRPDEVTAPRYARHGDAGFDLFAVEDAVVPMEYVKKIPLGFALEIPPGYEVQIRPRSGKTLQWGNYISNAPGTIDSSFRGEVCLLISAPFRPIFIKKGEAIAQGLLKRAPIAQFFLVDTLSQTDRGAGGFGHTGE